VIKPQTTLKTSYFRSVLFMIDVFTVINYRYKAKQAIYIYRFIQVETLHSYILYSLVLLGLQQCILILLFLTEIFYVQVCSLPTVIDETVVISQPCPLVKCAGPWLYGFIINKLGCQTCKRKPCKFGQPLYKYSCGQGLNTCSANNDHCKMSTNDFVYCCPSSPDLALVVCLPSSCKNDEDCSSEQKCCGPYSRCIDPILP
jgi:hypothetical protein